MQYPPPQSPDGRRTTLFSRCLRVAAVAFAAFGAACANAADVFSLQRAEFAKYYREITGREAPERIVRFAIDPKVSKSGRDAYRIVSLDDGEGAVGATRVTITGSNMRSVWYGLYDLLERRGGCSWFWDGDVVPKKKTIDLSGLDIYCDVIFQSYKAKRKGANNDNSNA